MPNRGGMSVAPDDLKSFSTRGLRPLRGLNDCPSLVHLGWLAMTTGAIAVAVLIGGATADEAGRSWAVLFLQCVGGAGVWTLLRTDSRVSAPEMVGVGLVLGPLIFTAVSMLLLVTPMSPTPLSAGGATVALGLLGVVLVFRAGKRTLLGRRVRSSEALVLLAAVPSALLVVQPLWSSVSLPRDIARWGSLGGDYAVGEAWANSIVTLGLHDSLLIEGQPLRYHWLGNAWSGFTQLTAGAGSYVVATRLLPLVAVVGTLLVTWCWIRLLSSSNAASWTAVALLAVGGTSAFGTTLYPLSMSQMWGAAIASVISLAWWLALLSRMRLAVPAMAFLSTGLVLAKSTELVFLPALVGSALFSTKSPLGRRRALLVSCAAGTAGLAAIVLFVSGYGSGLYLSLIQTNRYVGTSLPGDSSIALLLGLLLASVGLVAAWLPILNLCRISHPLRSEVLALALVLVGVAVPMTLFTGQWGQSQLYFAMSACAALVPLSGWGLYVAAKTIRATPMPIGVLTLAGLLIATAVWMFPWSRENQYFRPLLTIMVALCASAASLAWARGVASRWAVFVSVLTGVIAGSLFASGLLNQVQDRVSPPEIPPYSSTSSNSISIEHIEAVAWLKSANPHLELVATNFYCDNPDQRPPDCLSSQFPLAALGGQRMLIEGYSYSAGQFPEAWALDRVAATEEFITNPTDQSAARLWEMGVRWLYVDRRRTPSDSWEPYADTAHWNSTATVLRLNPATIESGSGSS
jgi:hypothetical protein